MVRVFLSQNGPGTARTAQALAEKLRQRGMFVSGDGESNLGASLQASVIKAVESCDVFVAVVSARQAGNANVFFELGIARALGKKVVVIADKPLEDLESVDMITAPTIGTAEASVAAVLKHPLLEQALASATS